jgi:putative phage-type endonuclease
MTLTKEQLKERTKYIGASEAAAVIGLSRWETPLSIWSYKTGQIEESSNSLAAWLGNELEETVAKLFTKETGKKVRRVNEPFTHKEHDFIKCHIDRKVEGEPAILQCKTASAWKAKEWKDDIPAEYLIQEYHELACSGYERAYIAVLIGNQDFKMKVLKRDDKIIKDIIDKEVFFWKNFVLTGQMPIVSAQDNETLLALFPDAKMDSFIELENPDDINRTIELLEGLKSDRTQVENRIEQLENTLKQALQDNEAGQTNRYQVTWKNQTQERINSKKLKEEQPEIAQKYITTSSFRVLRYKEVKEKE